MPKLILSLDGGGIRGAATSQFLARIEHQLTTKHGVSLKDKVDFFAGNSTGSIIALALATTNLSIAEINQLYSFENAKTIFSNKKGWLQGWLAKKGLFSPKFQASGKSELLKKHFGEARLGDVSDSKHILVTAYCLDKRKPEILKSTSSQHLKLFSWNLADASSAAPTFFPSKHTHLDQSQDKYWLIDGGVVANNPSMCAVSEAIHSWRDEGINNLRLLSIGTGYTTRKLQVNNSPKWGALGWFVKGDIMHIVTDERVVSYQASSILQPGNYIRVNSEMSQQPGLESPPKDEMDDISQDNIDKLRAMGEFWFSRYGQRVIEFILGSYTGPSLDRIDIATGQPKHLLAH